MLERSHATAWANDIGDSGRAVTRDERVAMALAQSHENLAAAAVRFEESQDRSSQLLGGLRNWLDRFTGTARPEDINPIAAMLPEPGLEDKVVELMTDCQVKTRVLERRENRILRFWSFFFEWDSVGRGNLTLRHGIQMAPFVDLASAQGQILV